MSQEMSKKKGFDQESMLTQTLSSPKLSVHQGWVDMFFLKTKLSSEEVKTCPDLKKILHIKFGIIKYI